MTGSLGDNFSLVVSSFMMAADSSPVMEVPGLGPAGVEMLESGGLMTVGDLERRVQEDPSILHGYADSLALIHYRIVHKKLKN